MRLPVVPLCIVLVGFSATTSGSPVPQESGENKTINNLHTEWKEHGEEGSNGDEIQMTRAYLRGARLWPRGKVIYQIDMSINEPQFIREIHIAAKSISAATCVKLIPRTRANANQPYLQFYRFTVEGKPGCSSLVGFRNQFPRVTVTPRNCDNHPQNYAESVVHEIIHALGFLHEFQRFDREGYIHYVGEEMGQRYEVNYGINRDGQTRGIPFNFKSIMQYDSALGFQEVKPPPANYPPPLGTFKNMGQECKISKGDIDLINSVYARQCKLRQPLRRAKGDYSIRGTNCNYKIEPMNDMIMNTK